MNLWSGFLSECNSECFIWQCQLSIPPVLKPVKVEPCPLMWGWVLHLLRPLPTRIPNGYMSVLPNTARGTRSLLAQEFQFVNSELELASGYRRHGRASPEALNCCQGENEVIFYFWLFHSLTRIIALSRIKGCWLSSKPQSSSRQIFSEGWWLEEACPHEEELCPKQPSVPWFVYCEPHWLPLPSKASRGRL